MTIDLTVPLQEPFLYARQICITTLEEEGEIVAFQTRKRAFVGGFTNSSIVSITKRCPGYFFFVSPPPFFFFFAALPSSEVPAAR